MRGTAVNRSFARAWLALGYAFLYVPIVALVVYSFNDSPVANVWRGFTLRWYAALASDRELLAGLALSLKVAFSTACASVVLGTLAAFALVRYRRFFGSTLFAGMVAAPLVMPEVIIGLSLLLMLVSLQRATEAAFGVGFPERGMLTIWLGHLLLGMAYATVVVRARLQTLNPQLEEAALDLGARPWQVFWLVTLPMIGQALLSAFLLTFTLSLDDVVLSAFLSGPGATTMPLVIFSRARLGLNPSVNAVATIIIAVVADRRRRRQLRDRPQRTAARARRRRGATARGPHEHVARAHRPRLPLPRRGDGDRRRLRRLLEGAGHRLPGLPARRHALRDRRDRDGAVAAPAGRRGRARPAQPSPALPRIVLRQLPVLDLHAVRHPPEHGARRRRDHGGAAGGRRPALVVAAEASASACASPPASPARSPASPWSPSRATPRASWRAARSSAAPCSSAR